MKPALIFLTPFLAFVLSACTIASSPPIGQWDLVAFGDVESPTPVLPDIEAHIFLSDEGHYNGSIGCNRFGGGYELARKNEIKPLIKWMSCNDTSNEEKEILQILTAEAIKYSLEEDQLILLSADETSALIFKRYLP